MWASEEQQGLWLSEGFFPKGICECTRRGHLLLQGRWVVSFCVLFYLFWLFYPYLILLLLILCAWGLLWRSVTSVFPCLELLSSTFFFPPLPSVITENESDCSAKLTIAPWLNLFPFILLSCSCGIKSCWSASLACWQACLICMALESLYFLSGKHPFH